MKKEKKEEILNALNGNFKIIEVRKEINDDIKIWGKFIKNGKRGEFSYTLIGEEVGIDGVRGYEEDDNEDIYNDIQDWLDENVSLKVTIKHKGKKI